MMEMKSPSETKTIKYKTWQGHELSTTISTKDVGQYNVGDKSKHPVAEVTGNTDYPSGK